MYSETEQRLDAFDNPHDFERMVADILNRISYRDVILIAPRGGSDGGKDITFTYGSKEKGLACVTLRKDIDAKFREDFYQRKPGEYNKYELFCTSYLTHQKKLEFSRYCINNLDAEFVPRDIEALRSLLDTSMIDIRRRWLYIEDVELNRRILLLRALRNELP